MERVRAFWGRSRGNKVAVLAGGILALCCICSVGLAGVRSVGQSVGLVPTNTATPVVTQTPVPTLTPVPSATSEPTTTPAPTDTPQPTATPEPTITPLSTRPPEATPPDTLTEAERQAVIAIGKPLGEIGGALAEISTLMQSYKNTNEWKASLVVQIVRVQLAHQTILEMKPPPKLGALRAAILNATADCDAAMDLLVSGIDKNKVSDIEKAGALMGTCGTKLQEAKPELDALIG